MSVIVGKKMLDDVTEGLNKEVNALRLKLQQNQDTFLSEWTGGQRQKLASSLFEDHHCVMAQGKEQILMNESRLKEIREQGQTNKKVLDDRRQKLKETKAEIQKLIAETDQILRKKEHIETEVDRATSNIEKENEFLALQTKVTQEKLSELDKVVAMFRDRLDFRFKKTSGGRLQFIFRSIDREDPDAAFYFFLKIEGEERKYIVSDCEPPVQDLEALVGKLNATNNLKSFIVCMRKRFQRIAIDDRKK